jgi:tetratricopeptide (TPR) repeat protein
MKRLAAVILLMGGLFSCGRSTPVAPAPPVVQVEEPVAKTLEEARADRSDASAYERDLRSLSRSEDPVTKRRALALLGLFLHEQKRFDEAVPALAQAAEHHPAVAPALRLRILEIEEQRGRFEPAIAMAQTIEQESPDSSVASIARLRLPALYAATGNQAAADTAYAQIASLPIDELTEDEWVRLADRLAKWQRIDLANAIRMRLLTQSTNGRWTEKVYGQLAAVTPSPLESMTLDASTNLASSLTRAGRLDQALDILQRVQRRFPQASSADSVRAVRIRSLFSSRNYDQLVNETSFTDLNDPALVLLRARAAWRSDQPQEFLNGLDLIEKRYPASREAIDAKVQRAKYFVTDNVDYAKSVANMQSAIDAGALASEGENLWTLGWTYTLWGWNQGDLGKSQLEKALQIFDRYLRTYPDGDYKTNSLFWSAKIHDRLGNREKRDASLRQVIAEYPYSYYAYRSREILGEPTVAPASVESGNVFPDLATTLAIVPPERLAAVEELLAIDLARDATREMKRVAAAYPDNAGVAFKLADVYVRGGEPFRANGILQKQFRQFVRHGGTGVPQRFWEVLFPLSYWETIRAEAAKQRVDPYQVTAIIRQESGFEPTTVSNAGAVGLMQIMPAEAARLGAAAGLTGVTRETLFDPVTNIAVGAAEIRHKLDSMKDNIVLAIAAYNAGEEAVGKWIAQTPVDDIDLFVEAIPYAETRLYVKTVTRNRFEYRRIYEGSNTAALESKEPVAPPPHLPSPTLSGDAGRSRNATPAQPRRG